MPTISTTTGTITTLMSLVDANSDQLKEGEYLSICNLMRDLHRCTIQTPSSPVRNPEDEFETVANTEDSHARERDEWTVHSERLNNVLWRLAQLRRSNPRICLEHKFNVLSTLDNNMVANLPQGRRTMSRWVCDLESMYLINHSESNPRFLEIKYREFVNDINQREINRLRLQVAQMRVNRRAARDARDTEEENGLPYGSVDVWNVRITSLDHPMVPP